MQCQYSMAMKFDKNIKVKMRHDLQNNATRQLLLYLVMIRKYSKVVIDIFKVSFSL